MLAGRATLLIRAVDGDSRHAQADLQGGEGAYQVIVGWLRDGHEPSSLVFSISS